MNTDIKNSITEREKEILSLLAIGLSSKEISEKLFISPHTVEYHRRQLLKKTKITKHRTAHRNRLSYGNTESVVVRLPDRSNCIYQNLIYDVI